MTCSQIEDVVSQKKHVHLFIQQILSVLVTQVTELHPREASISSGESRPLTLYTSAIERM